MFYYKVRIDEGFFLFSDDVVLKMLNQTSEKMLCHKFGGQQVAIWNQLIPIEEQYSCSKTIHHSPAAEYIQMFKSLTNACSSYIAIHGCSPKLLETLWSHENLSSQSTVRSKTTVQTKTILNDSFVCTHGKHFDYKKFQNEWFASPHLCKEHFGFVSDQRYIGRVH